LRSTPPPYLREQAPSAPPAPECDLVRANPNHSYIILARRIQIDSVSRLDPFELSKGVTEHTSAMDSIRHQPIPLQNLRHAAR